MSDDAATDVVSRQQVPVVTTYRLEVVQGPDKGARFVVAADAPSRSLVGCGPSCGILLNDRSASRRHATLDVEAGGLRIIDLESTNGTFVGALRVRDALLRGGERVTVGGTTFVVVAEGTTPPRLDESRSGFGKVIGASFAMRRLYPTLDALARTSIPVLIEGETGTGKEVVAEAIHEASPRAAGPFVVFDCTAVPASLVESALFGHTKGAFTGAISSRRGVFEQAHGGTLLIDEIGELEPTLQPKLLRALERREIQRVGANDWIKVEVRTLAATRRDLDREVAEGRFRDDLFFRLAVGRIELPPLRERHGDVELLAQHFLAGLQGTPELLQPGLLARLVAYPWPGNVRELANSIARLVALGDADLRVGMSADTAPDPGLLRETAGGNEILAAVQSGLPFPRAKELVVEAFERHFVEHMLRLHGGNVMRAAASAGIARRYFQIIKKRYA